MMNQIMLNHLMARYPDIASNGFGIGDREIHLDEAQLANKFLFNHTRRCLVTEGTLSRDLMATAEQEYGTTICEGAIIIAALHLFMIHERVGHGIRAGVRVIKGEKHVSVS